MNILVLSASLSPQSRSRVLALAAMQEVERLRGVTGAFLDLHEVEMQFCDGRPTSAYNADTQHLIAAVAAADGILIAFPVYNYSFNAAAKNVVELAGPGFVGKRVGLLSAAGGVHSYMAPQTLAQCLILDFQTTVIPRYVYATGAHFEGNELVDLDVRERIARLVRAVAEPAEPPVI
jgi:NAD(P)H-dependent FMN reductase